MAGKKQTPPPIDRPLSKAYLRQFTGWSNNYPPGQTEPNSLRFMENVWVDRNGAVRTRPGLRCLSWTVSPDIDPRVKDVPGSYGDLRPVGAMEPFYLNDGTRAMLFAVREVTRKVGFRVLLLMGSKKTVLTLAEAGFTGTASSDYEFSENTTYVSYVQIDSTIIALSDNGEPARHFYSGVEKYVEIPKMLSSPEYRVLDKPTLIHPDAGWINTSVSSTEYNLVIDPFPRNGSAYYTAGPDTKLEQRSNGTLRLRSLPLRTNLVCSPLVSFTGLDATNCGWFGDGNTAVQIVGQALQASAIDSGWIVVRSAKMVDGIQEKRRYRLAFEVQSAEVSQLEVAIMYYSASGDVIGAPTMYFDTRQGRKEKDEIRTPEGTVAAKLEFRAKVGTAGQNFRINKVLLCLDGETSVNTFDGYSPTSTVPGAPETDPANYYWTGGAYRSPSVYHPPTEVSVLTHRIACDPGAPYSTGLGCVASNSGYKVSVGFEWYDVNNVKTRGSYPGTPANIGVSGTTWTGLENQTPQSAPTPEMFLREKASVQSLKRGDWIDMWQFHVNPQATSRSIHGSYPDSDTVFWDWEGEPNASVSKRTMLSAARPALSAEAPVATTLVSSDASKNTHKVGVFYTFENAVGESKPSQITELRIQRGYANWLWKVPGADGSPGADTTDDTRCADQLVVRVPEAVFKRAVAEGALRWNVYMIAWSDQEAVPVEAALTKTVELYPDPYVRTTQPPSWALQGWVALTPRREISSELTPLPTKDSPNTSSPLRHKAGAAAADRLVMVGDPTNPASIMWSSNIPGSYTSFGTGKGGGIKVLSSGNLHIPHAVVLWQNPQSVDTLTVLCTSDTERSITYYMNQFTTTAQNNSISGMGFEETTNTPGSESPYAVEVLNNALYRPTDTSFMKSTASNYNISHKIMTEMISRSWSELLDKYRMVSTQLDNRLYLLVNNAKGEPLKRGCVGNEIWVLDIAAEQGHWSRFCIQAASLDDVEVGGRTYVGVLNPQALGGIYYLDPDYLWDDYPNQEGKVVQRPIPWMIETNMQGANRAHDAWAHLQQASLTVGSYHGTVEWGVKGYDRHGRWIDVSKVTTAQAILEPDPPEYGQSDYLLVRKDMMEWYFYARSLPDEQGNGSIQLVQYRYTPVTVNVGYEYGSVETFEYGTPSPDAYAANGVPQPFSDAGRTWM